MTTRPVLFFFQAEDGIRDYKVTGVQTCALPIWQVAADANLAGATYPDQSLYPANSAPALVRRLNNALVRADQIACSEGDDSVDWLLPIVADAEAGFGGCPHAVQRPDGEGEGGG